MSTSTSTPTPGLTTSFTATAKKEKANAARSPYIVGPVYDWIFFLAPPLASLAIGFLISDSWLTEQEFTLFSYEVTPAHLFIGMFIHAHLVIVFFRSHGNRNIFKLYPFRFIWVPPLLYLAMLSSTWVLIFVSVLATFWDVYHSGMQTFGFARIYDGRAGNDPQVGRHLDWILNQLLYAGPIVAGATMFAHFEDFYEFEEVGSAFFTAIPAFMESNQRIFTWAILFAGTWFLVYYLLRYWSLHREGYRVSFPKVFLLASTGFVSVYAWGFNSFGEAFFIMNLFHALQYFGIVWWSEKKRLMKSFGVANRSWGPAAAAIGLVLFGMGYGFLVEAGDTDLTWWWALTLVVSIMHFWYDGFIWSVRKKQV